MRRTVLIADPDATSRERVARSAQDAGYRVLQAQSPPEICGALAACPISATIIDEELIRQRDLRRLLLRTQVVVLSTDRHAPLTQDVAVVPKDLSGAEMVGRLIGFIGDPCYSGPRAVVPLWTEPHGTDNGRATTT